MASTSYPHTRPPHLAAQFLVELQCLAVVHDVTKVEALQALDLSCSLHDVEPQGPSQQLCAVVTFSVGR